MINGIPNFKSLEWYQDSFLDIADELDNSGADMRIVVPMFGKGKSTVCLGMLDSQEAWCMGTWDQINSKIKTANEMRLELPGCSLNKCHRVTGKLRWLGLKMQNGRVVEEDGYVPSETLFYNESAGILNIAQLEPARRQFFKDVGKKKLKQDIEDFGIETVWKYHNGADIIEMYREHISEEVLNNVKIFTTTELIPMLTSRNLADEIMVDEGVEGEKINFGSLGERGYTLKVLNGGMKTSQVTTSLLTTDSDIELENYIDQVRAELNRFYDEIETGKADFVFKSQDGPRGRVSVDLHDILDTKTMERLRKDWKKDMKENMIREIYAKDKIYEMNSLQESMEVIDWLFTAWKYCEQVIVDRDGYEIQNVEGVYPRYQNLIDYSVHVGNTVTIIQTVADRELPKIYEKKFEFEDAGLISNGMSLDIIGEDKGIEKKAMVRKPFDRYGWNGGSLTKQDMETSLFRDGIIEMIDKLGEVSDTGVILPNSGRGDDNINYPEKFHNALSANFTVDGTNDFAEVDYLFVLSQRRINGSKMYEPLIDWYLEPVKVEEISQYIKTNDNNEQIGYTETDIDWRGDYPDDYHLLDRIWQNLSVKNTVEKLFRRRDPWTSEGKTVRLGNGVEFRGNKFTSTKGNQTDFVEFLLQSMKKQGLSNIDIAEFLSSLDMNSHAVNTVHEVIEESNLTLPLSKKRDGNTSYFALNKESAFLEKAVELGYDSLGRTQKVSVPDICEETGLKRRTIYHWVNEEKDIWNYLKIEKGGRGRGNSTTVEPTGSAHMFSDSVDSDKVRNRRNQNTGRQNPFR